MTRPRAVIAGLVLSATAAVSMGTTATTATADDCPQLKTTKLLQKESDDDECEETCKFPAEASEGSEASYEAKMEHDDEVATGKEAQVKTPKNEAFRIMSVLEQVDGPFTSCKAKSS
ncbi:hypothetical protein ACFYVL_31840 [Streptomyces sp. NPDC004111]|uniref:hypothetical protein n=1 Tax=Streptomyces sp. NPDC004111 TaxID=3364690 RepID=UPI0036AF4F2F